MLANKQNHSGAVGRPQGLVLGLLLLAIPLTGCTFVADFKDYDELPTCDEGDVQSPRDLRLRADAMDAHNGQYLEVRVINDSDFVVARAILDPHVGSTFDIGLRGAVLPGPHRVDFWADLSGNGAYDSPSADHAWRLPTCNSGAYRFTHNFGFADITEPPVVNAGADFTLELTDMGFHQGQLLETWVIEATTGRMAGYYRLAPLPSADYSIRIPGIVDPGVTYLVAVYADLSGNGVYDPPPADHAWLLEGTADASGLTVPFTHNGTFTDISEEITL